MCFNVEIGCSERTAEKDIVCYKVMNYDSIEGTILSLYTNFEYKLDKVYKLNEKLKISMMQYNDPYISHGFHSFITLSSIGRIGIEGIGSHLSEKIFKCIIPKGSTYYSNDIDLMVSDAIIIKKICWFSSWWHKF